MSTTTAAKSRSSLARFALPILVGMMALLVAACGKTASATSAPAQHISSKLNLTIVAQGPDKSIQGPAYSPSAWTLPANTLVTVTIVNHDPGDTSLPANSQFARIAGVTNNTAYVDGVAYTSLSPDKVAHTFTVPQLGINVPIPGDAPAGHQDITVTFTFKTGAAGSYIWQCMDPCGSGTSGWQGPMSTRGYMTGTLTVE